jgi:ribonuclease HI
VIDVDQEATFDINIYEVRAVRLALEQWGPQWRHQRLVIFTDNNATFRGIKKGYLDNTANNDLRRLLCLAVEYDINLQPHWLAGINNQLADALSRFDFNSIANWCPHWQLPSTTSFCYHHLRNSGSMKWNLGSPTKQS